MVPDLSRNVIEFAKMQLQHHPQYQDIINYVQASFYNIPYPTAIATPLSEEDRYYLVEHTEWLTQKAAPFLSPEELQM